MGKHYRDMEMEEQLWYSLPISEDLALAMDESLSTLEHVLTVSKQFIIDSGKAVGEPEVFATIGDDANLYIVEKGVGFFVLVGTIECNEIGVFVARAFGASDFWTALAVEDALMEVLS